MTSQIPTPKTPHIKSYRITLLLTLGLALGLFATPQALADTSTPALPGHVSSESSKTGKTEMMMKKKSMMAGSDINDIHACNTDGLALAGIDVVSYHKPTGPLIGSTRFTAQHEGLTYRFLSQAHLDEFRQSPQRYLPSYLGWCATSLALGALTCPNPLNYKLENGKLLLFETTGFTNGQDLWNADPRDYRRRADRNRDDFLSSATHAPVP